MSSSINVQAEVARAAQPCTTFVAQRLFGSRAFFQHLPVIVRDAAVLGHIKLQG